MSILPRLPKEIWYMILDCRTDIMITEFIWYNISKDRDFIGAFEILSRGVEEDKAISLYCNYMKKFINILINKFKYINPQILNEQFYEADKYINSLGEVNKTNEVNGTSHFRKDFLIQFYTKRGYYNISDIVSPYCYEEDVVDEYLYGYETSFWDSFGGLNELQYSNESIKKSIHSSIESLKNSYLCSSASEKNTYRQLAITLLDKITEMYPDYTYEDILPEFFRLQ